MVWCLNKRSEVSFTLYTRDELEDTTSIIPLAAEQQFPGSGQIEYRNIYPLFRSVGDKLGRNTPYIAAVSRVSILQ